MKTIGLLGGMSWESTVEYYQIINEEVKKRLGGTHSAKIIMNSVDFFEIEALQHENDWDQLDRLMIDASKQIERAGADCLVICTNTMHKSVPAIEKEISIPIIHIADATAEKIKENGLHQIGLLGTRFTMEQDFYKGRLVNNFDLDVVIPEEPGLTQVHDIIYNELVLGEIHESSRKQYLEIIKNLMNKEAEGIILGCTEIGLLVKQEDTSVPVFDTTEIHAIAAVDFALSE
jgi:aspartate racemase